MKGVDGEVGGGGRGGGEGRSTLLASTFPAHHSDDIEGRFRSEKQNP